MFLRHMGFVQIRRPKIYGLVSNHWNIYFLIMEFPSLKISFLIYGKNAAARFPSFFLQIIFPMKFSKFVFDGKSNVSILSQILNPILNLI